MLSQWIIQETENGKKIQLAKLLEKIISFNNDFDSESAKRWFKMYVKRYPEIRDRLIFNGDYNILNIKVKN